MAAASSFHSTMALRCVPSPCNHRPLVVHLRANLLLPRHPCRLPLVAFSRRRSKTISAITSSQKNQQMVPRNEIIKEDDVDKDDLESPFGQQEEDLEHDDPSLAELESELEEDLAELEREFEALAKLERVLDKALRVLSDVDDDEDDDDDDEDTDNDDTDEKIMKLPTNLVNLEQMMPYNVVTKEDVVDDDAMEREFEEDLAKLERELDEVLRALSDDDDDEEEEDDDDSDGDNDAGEKLVMLPKNLERSNHNEVTKEDDADKDTLEALFSQLEEDLENGDPYLDDGDGEIGEKDLAKLERELEEALGDDELLGAFNSLEDDEVDKKIEYDGDYNDYTEKQLVKLKNWPLRRLAYALKSGKLKISIKNLAADICLDRSVVLQLLRDHPPNLLLLSAALPDKPISPISRPESKTLETVPSEIVEDVALPETKVEEPVHVM